MLLCWTLPVLGLMGGNKAEVDLHARCAPRFPPQSSAKVWAPWP